MCCPAPPVLRALGHAIDWIVKTPANAPAKVAFLSMALGWLNWGLGLIAGAILVRGVMDRRRREGSGSPLEGLSLGVLGAAGYTGLLVWHGGLGGSAPLKVAESGHMAKLIPNASWLNEVPDALPLSQTALTGWSQAVTLSVMVVVVLTFIWLGRRIGAGEANALPQAKPTPQASEEQGDGGLADVLDRRKVVAYVLGVGCLVGALSWAVNSGPLTKLAFVTPDWINMVLLGAAMLAHGQIRGMLRALDEAISGASGIWCNSPVLRNHGHGLRNGVRDVARRFVGWGDVVGVVARNVVCSSGVLNVRAERGGQWAVQGLLVLEACHALGLPLERESWPWPLGTN